MAGAAKMVGSVVGSVVGGVVGGINAEGNAGIDRGVAAQQEGYRKAGEHLKPWETTGADALKNLYDMALGKWDFKTDPGYDFRLQEGEKAIERAAGGPGGPGRYSGATLKALTQYGQNFASNEYGTAYSRRAGTLLPIMQIGGEATLRHADYIAGEGEAAGAGETAKARMGSDTASGIFQGIGAGLGAYARS